MIQRGVQSPACLMRCISGPSRRSPGQLRQVLADGVPPATVLMAPALWQRQQTARWDRRTWVVVRGRHPAHHDGLAAWRSTAATCAQSRPRPGRGEDTGCGTRHQCVATDRMAGRQQHAAELAVCPLASRPAHGDAR